MTALLERIWSASLYGGVIIGVILLLRLVLKGVPRKYICLLWLLAAVRLLVPIEIESSLSLQPDLEAVTIPGTARVEQIMSYHDSGSGDEPLVLPTEAVPDPQPEQPSAAISGPTFVIERDVPLSALILENYEQILAWGWICVAAGLLAYSAIAYLRLRRRVRDSVIVSEGVWQNAGLDTAFVLGFFRPQIYLPAGLTARDREFVLAHERQHIRRGDPWWKVLGFVTLAVHWFNPLVWVAYLCLCKDLEIACDEAVVRGMDVRERKDYSAALLSCAARRPGIAACPVAFGEVSVKARIKKVLNYRKPGFWVVLAAVVAIVTVAVCFLTSPGGLTEEEMLEQCRQELEKIQSAYSYHLTENMTATGPEALLENQDTAYWRSGEDFYYRVSTTDWTEEYLQKDGRKFHKDTTSAVPETEIPNPVWIEVDAFDELAHDCWLMEFQWEDHEISYHASSRDTYRNVTLSVTEGTLLTFQFDKRTDRLCAVVKSVENEGMSTVSTVVIEAVDDGTAAEMIDSCYAEAAGVNDWGLTLYASDVTAKGMTLLCQQDGTAVAGILGTGSYYWLERWTDSGWVPVEEIPPEDGVERAWTSELRLITMGATTRWDVDWSGLYGELNPGTYRIGKIISQTVEKAAGMPSVDREETVYAQFTVGEAQSELTREDALAMCIAAYEELQNAGSYRVMVTSADAFIIFHYIAGEDYFVESIVQTGYDTLMYQGKLFFRVQPMYMENKEIPYGWMSDSWATAHYPGVFDGEREEFFWENTDWESLSLELRPWEQHEDGITLTFTEEGDYDRVWTFTLDTEGKMAEITFTPDRIKTTKWTFVGIGKGYIADQIRVQYASAYRESPDAVIVRDQAFYEELFTRKADGAYATMWKSHLFEALYAQPEEFTRQLSRKYSEDPALIQSVLTSMSYEVQFYEPERFVQVLAQLRKVEDLDQSAVDMLSGILTSYIQSCLTREEGYWYLMALSSEYADPADVDLYEMFYNFAEDGHTLTDAEEAFLDEIEPDWRMLDVNRLSTKEMDAILLDCFGLTLAQTNGLGLDRMLRWEVTGCYYELHTDSNVSTVTVQNVTVQEDGTLRVSYIREWRQADMVAGLAIDGEGFTVLYNLPADA